MQRFIYELLSKLKIIAIYYLSLTANSSSKKCYYEKNHLYFYLMPYAGMYSDALLRREENLCRS